jgi:hypothetical protein
MIITTSNDVVIYVVAKGNIRKQALNQTETYEILKTLFGLCVREYGVSSPAPRAPCLRLILARAPRRPPPRLPRASHWTRYACGLFRHGKGGTPTPTNVPNLSKAWDLAFYEPHYICSFATTGATEAILKCESFYVHFKN